MAITLGGVALSDSTVWVDREVPTPVLQDRKLTLGAKAIITVVGLSEGREITLEGHTGTGWITKAVYDAILALSLVAGATYTFDYNGEQHTVMFRHEDAPAVSGSPLVYRNNQETTDYYIYTIKLITV